MEDGWWYSGRSRFAWSAEHSSAGIQDICVCSAYCMLCKLNWMYEAVNCGYMQTYCTNDPVILMLMFWTNFCRLFLISCYNAILTSLTIQLPLTDPCDGLECIHVLWRLFRMSDRRIVCESFLKTVAM